MHFGKAFDKMLLKKLTMQSIFDKILLKD